MCLSNDEIDKMCYIKCQDGKGCIPVCLTYYNRDGWYSPFCLSFEYKKTIVTPIGCNYLGDNLACGCIACHGSIIKDRCNVHGCFPMYGNFACNMCLYECAFVGLLNVITIKDSVLDTVCLCFGIHLQLKSRITTVYTPLVCCKYNDTNLRITSLFGCYDNFPKELDEGPSRQFMGDICVICQNSTDVKYGFSPCGHVCICDKCSQNINRLNRCPMCNETFSGVYKK